MNNPARDGERLEPNLLMVRCGNCDGVNENKVGWAVVISESQLLAKASEVLRPFGCEVSALGPNGVHRREFGHVYGPSVIVRAMKGGATAETLARMTMEVTTRVSGITGVSFAGLGRGAVATE